MKYFTIGEAAAMFHIPESTLRFYEKKGLLPFIQRDDAGRRLFSERQLTLLKVVTCLKNTNMPINQIKQYLDWVVEGNSTLEERYDMLLKHKQNVLDEIALMQEYLKEIDGKLDQYEKLLKEEENQ